MNYKFANILAQQLLARLPCQCIPGHEDSSWPCDSDLPCLVQKMPACRLGQWWKKAQRTAQLRQPVTQGANFHCEKAKLETLCFQVTHKQLVLAWWMEAVESNGSTRVNIDLSLLLKTTSRWEDIARISRGTVVGGLSITLKPSRSQYPTQTPADPGTPSWECCHVNDPDSETLDTSLSTWRVVGNGDLQRVGARLSIRYLQRARFKGVGRQLASREPLFHITPNCPPWGHRPPQLALDNQASQLVSP